MAAWLPDAAAVWLLEAALVGAGVGAGVGGRKMVRSLRPVRGAKVIVWVVALAAEPAPLAPAFAWAPPSAPLERGKSSEGRGWSIAVTGGRLAAVTMSAWPVPTNQTEGLLRQSHPESRLR